MVFIPRSFFKLAVIGLRSLQCKTLQTFFVELQTHCLMMWKATLKIVGIVLLLLLALAVLYILSEYVLSRMSGTKVEKGGNRDIPVFILSNGVHTDLVFPVQNPQIDWSQLFPYSNTIGGDRAYRYVGIGWGTKAFIWIRPNGKT